MAEPAKWTMAGVAECGRSLAFNPNPHPLHLIAQAMTNLALITGASAGIGKELARQHAPHGDSLLVARREAELKALQAELDAHGHASHVLAMDLTSPDAPAKVAAFCDDQGLEVDCLINNAGFGAHGRFVESDLPRQRAMVELNIQSLVALTHHFVGPMVERGRGRVLQVGSTAGFVPGPMQATYFATKAFVNSFSQALNEELRGTGVTSTVLCPGPIATEFAEVADLEKTGMFKKAYPATTCAEVAYKGMLKGKDVVVYPRPMGALDRVSGLLPRRLVAKQVRKMQDA